jgi:DNA-binding Lrp family transcriptional regulator
MTMPDPVDARLLALVAEVGRVAVHDLARHVGMDVREVAARLAGLAATGLPLVVGVECDQAALRYALSVGWPPAPPRQPPGQQVQTQLAPSYSPPAAPNAMQTWGPPGSATWARGDELNSATVRTAPPGKAAGARTGKVGDVLYTAGLEVEQLAIRLVEVVDPADFLFTAAGYRLQPGERSVVVHTELTNNGRAPYASLPDLYLVLVDDSGKPVPKAPVSLSSRPPYRIGVKPGETAAGHTVYVLPEAVTLSAVRWSPRPDDDKNVVTWTLRR